MEVKAKDVGGEKAVIHSKKPQRMSKWPPIILAGIFFLIFCWSGLTNRHWDSFPVRAVTAILPIPAAFVNGSMITYHDLLKRKDVLVWLQGADANHEQLLSAALQVLIEQKVTEQLAEKMDVSISNADLDAAKKKLQGSMSDADFSKNVKEHLNMSTGEFTNTVLRPLALAQKLDSVVASSNQVQKDALIKIGDAAARLKAGESFATVAEQDSDDSSAASGGDIGYLTPKTIPDGWQALLNVPEGEVTPVMETTQSFVIAKVAGLIGMGETVQIRTQVITVNKKTLHQLVMDYIATSTVDHVIHLSE